MGRQPLAIDPGGIARRREGRQAEEDQNRTPRNPANSMVDRPAERQACRIFNAGKIPLDPAARNGSEGRSCVLVISHFVVPLALLANPANRTRDDGDMQSPSTKPPGQCP